MKKTVSIIKQEIAKRGEVFELSAEVVIKRGKNKVIDFPIVARYSQNVSDLSDKINTLIRIKWNEYQECQAVLKSAELSGAILSAIKQSGALINKGEKTK